MYLITVDRLIKLIKDIYTFFNKREFDFLMLYTNRDCTLDCIYCYCKGQDYPQGKHLSFSEYRSLISQAKDLGTRSILFGRVGEPLGNKLVLKLIDYVSKEKMKPVVCTNGIFIDAKMADFLYRCNANIIMKIDALNPDVQNYLAGKPAYSYKQYTYRYKNNYQSVSIPSGLYYLLKRGFSKNFFWPYKPSVMGHTALSKINKPYIDEIVMFARSIGLKVILQPLRDCTRIKNSKEEILLTKEEYEDVYKIVSRIYGESNKFFQENQKYFFCIGQRPIIDEYGNMLCFLPDRYTVGNIREESLASLWSRRKEMDDFKLASQRKYACHNIASCPLSSYGMVK